MENPWLIADLIIIFMGACGYVWLTTRKQKLAARKKEEAIQQLAPPALRTYLAVRLKNKSTERDAGKRNLFKSIPVTYAIVAMVITWHLFTPGTEAAFGLKLVSLFGTLGYAALFAHAFSQFMTLHTLKLEDHMPMVEDYFSWETLTYLNQTVGTAEPISKKQMKTILYRPELLVYFLQHREKIESQASEWQKLMDIQEGRTSEVYPYQLFHQEKWVAEMEEKAQQWNKFFTVLEQATEKTPGSPTSVESDLSAQAAQSQEQAKKLKKEIPALQELKEIMQNELVPPKLRAEAEAVLAEIARTQEEEKQRAVQQAEEQKARMVIEASKRFYGISTKK